MFVTWGVSIHLSSNSPRSTLTHWMENVCGISPCWVPAVENFRVSVQQTIRIFDVWRAIRQSHAIGVCMRSSHACDVLLSIAEQAWNDDTHRVPTGFDKNVRCIFSIARLLNVVTCRAAIRLRCKVRNCMCTWSVGNSLLPRWNDGIADNSSWTRFKKESDPKIILSLFWLNECLI